MGVKPKLNVKLEGCLHVQLLATERSELIELCLERGLTVSSVVRRAVRRELKRMKNEDTTKMA